MRKLGIVMIVGSLAILLMHFAGEYYAADMCIDSGQVYDYATSQCRADVDQLPYIPYAKRFSWLITTTIIALLTGIAFVVIGRKK
jgi:hypothetical protein